MRFFSKGKKYLGWLAVSFREDGVCLAQILRRKEEKPLVQMFAFHPTDKAGRRTLLDKIAKDLQKSRSELTTILTTGEYQFLAVEAPNVPQDELKTAIRWRLKDMLDFSIDEATIDVLSVPADSNGGMRNQSMYAVAARNDVIQQRQELFSGAEIPVKVIDVPEMAQRNIAALLEEPGRGLALLSFDENGGLLTLTYNGELYLSRRIDITLAQLQQTDPIQLDAHHDRVTLEVQRSLDHFDRQYSFITISKLMLATLDIGTGSLRAYLASNLYVPVEVLALEDILDVSKVPRLMQPEEQPRFFMTLGAALRYEEKPL